MKPDRAELEKTLRQHLSLFGSPSSSQLDASRGRIRERLRVRREATAGDTAEIRASREYAWRMGLLLATVAAGLVLVVTAPWKQAEWIATVEAADGSRYTIKPDSVLRSNNARGTMLALKDGSRVEMRSQSELSLERASDGIGIRLLTGGLVVNAAKPHDDRWHLYVHTKDMTVAVAGTLFVVNAEDSGSRVTVIEGEVHVREGSPQGAIEKRLRPGEQISTSSALATRPMKEEVGWSLQADAILAAFARGMADTAAPLRPSDPSRPNNPLKPSAGTAAAFGPVGAEAASPEFEEASVRECDPDHLPPTPEGGRGGGANSFRLTPGRLHALCMTVATLIRTAYGYSPSGLDFVEGPGLRDMKLDNVYGLGVEDGRRVRGGPDWMRSERYTIEAVAGADLKPDAQTLRGEMLQRLLERRFQLKAHIESEQVPAFALTVAKGGLKIQPVASGACEPLPGRPGSPLLNGYPGSVLTPPRKFAEVRSGEKPSCGLWSQRNGPNMVFVGGDVPLNALAQNLAFRLGGIRVLDHTNMTGRFNFILEFVLDENSPGLRVGNLPDPPGAELTDVAPAGTIFTAVEEQLGLKLERAQASRDFIVVDHVEHPSPN